MDAFVSTRGRTPPTPFSQALLHGLAPDGGLYVPRDMGRFGTLPPPPDATLSDHGVWAGETLLADAVSPDTLRAIVSQALDFTAPLVEVADGVHVLELFHGPSLAFKDVGARFMARAMAALDPGGPVRTVLVATSGDTGGAVAAAFHGLPGYRVVVLFPQGGISERQRRQMSTLGGNVSAVAVEGTFDDCQRLAKGAFADGELREACALTSANSINIGRLIPQTFYYVHAAARLGWDRDDVTYVVPSGNLGNLFAGLLARRAGMPVRGFLAATNRNRGFVDYLESGRTQDAPSVPTVSNAMDVGAPSNLERIRWLYDDDVARVRGDVTGASVTDPETLDCIRRVHAVTGYLLDPHAAVGWRAMERTRGDRSGVHVLLATAHPAKFPDVVERATGSPVPLPPLLAERLGEVEHVVHLPADARALRDHLFQTGPR